LEKIARQVKTSVNKGELQGRNLIVTFQFKILKFFCNRQFYIGAGKALMGR